MVMAVAGASCHWPVKSQPLFLIPLASSWLLSREYTVSVVTDFDQKAFLKSLTTRPGVYQMYDVDGKLLYVGKARNLKNRVGSYFRASGLTEKTMALVARIADIQVTVTSTEVDALLLEHNLIKNEQPPYNILLRDDKSYPYIFMSGAEAYPRISLHRGAKRRKGEYFGPYPSAGAVRESLHFLQKVFK